MQISLISKRVLGLACAASLAFALASCAPEPGDTKPDTPEASQPPAATPEPAPEEKPAETPEAKPEEEKPEARTQADSCEWEIPALASPSVVSVDGQEGDISELIVGSWQHTHFIKGDVFDTVDNDIRYVFPAADKLIYCQDVPGITDQAENRADISLDGLDIVLPGSAPGYTILAWTDSEMLWLNKLDNSKYLLQRR